MVSHLEKRTKGTVPGSVSGDYGPKKVVNVSACPFSFVALLVERGGRSVGASNDSTLLSRLLAYRDGCLLKGAEAGRAGQVLNHTLKEEPGQERLRVVLLSVLCYRKS